MRSVRACFVCLFLIFALSAGGASPAGQTGIPKAERKAILNALRAPVQKELKQKVVFKVDRLTVCHGWAFLMGVPQRPNGRAVDYRSTRYAAHIREGAFDDGIAALLRKKQGKWHVVTYVIGATDVPYEGWDRRYHAPASLFR